MNTKIQYLKQFARNHWITEDGEELFLRYSGKREANSHTGRYHFSGKLGQMVPYEDTYDLWLGRDRLARDITEDEVQDKLIELGYQIRR
jgi:hypothetical protein